VVLLGTDFFTGIPFTKPIFVHGIPTWSYANIGISQGIV